MRSIDYKPLRIVKVNIIYLLYDINIISQFHCTVNFPLHSIYYMFLSMGITYPDCMKMRSY